MRKPFRLEQEGPGAMLGLYVCLPGGDRFITWVAFRDDKNWMYYNWFAWRGWLRACYRHNRLSIARDVKGNPRKDLGLVKKEPKP